MNQPAVLVVDDEPSVALTLKMVFERQGYTASMANSCAEALKALASDQQFDVIITDLNMEKPDIGLEVARVAQKLEYKPVVVICTGYANVSNTQSALQMRVDYLATKPTDLQDLLLAVKRLLAVRQDKLSHKAGIR
jgi:DNA-binding NtrC family response regulator